MIAKFCVLDEMHRIDLLESCLPEPPQSCICSYFSSGDLKVLDNMVLALAKVMKTAAAGSNCLEGFQSSRIWCGFQMLR